MFLRHHPDLGLLPDAIVLAFLIATVSALGATMMLVLRRTPVLLVADADCCGRCPPAQADDDYLRSFASDFLQHWESWNTYTCAFRQGEAITMLAPVARMTAAASASHADSLRSSLQQSQDLVLAHLTVSQRDSRHGLYDVAFDGDLTTYFGGVGGEADSCHGHLYLHAITPTSLNPLCLEVVGFTVNHPGESP